MSLSSNFNETFKRAVTPGSDRLLTGVALVAAARNGRDGKPNPPDFNAAYGTLQLDPASGPVTTDTVMWIASCSKLVTTIAALQCVERGLFTLDDPTAVDRLLPEWKDPEILTGFTEDGKPILQPAKEKITLRKLLTHTSGVAYDMMHPMLIQWRQSRGEKPLAVRTPVTEGYKHPLVFEPGFGWMYGAGHDLAGLMVARANETSLEEYMRKNIFNVLGMNDTTFHVKKHGNLASRLMPISTRDASGELMDGEAPDAIIPAPLNPPDDQGGAGLFSTAADYLKLLKSILVDDGKLLKSETIDLVFTPTMTEVQQAYLNALLSDPGAAAIMIPGEPVLGTPGAGNWTQSVGGVIGLHHSEGEFQPGWLKWGGAPNLTWWIDRKGGTCGMFATQLNPAGDVKHAFLGKMFYKEVVSHFGSNETTS